MTREWLQGRAVSTIGTYKGPGRAPPHVYARVFQTPMSRCTVQWACGWRSKDAQVVHACLKVLVRLNEGEGVYYDDVARAASASASA